MSEHRDRARRTNVGVRALGAACLAALAVAALGCGGRRPASPPGGVSQPDRFLFERATQALKDRDWTNARTYFQQIVDGYPQSPVRPDAKLGMGDAYLGENTPESLVSSANEFREFLQFYPTSQRADYAQYKIAMTHFQQMRAPDRDQSETRAALTEFDTFFQKFPNSALTAEVKDRWRIARDRLSEASYRVGLLYYRLRWDPGAISRFQEVLKEDPAYGGRDGVYFYLAESLARSDKKAEAIPYLERLLAEFDRSEYLENARERLQELKIQ
jgi:outer membrane protein assembly factor BamD